MKFYVEMTFYVEKKNKKKKKEIFYENFCGHKDVETKMTRGAGYR